MRDAGPATSEPAFLSDDFLTRVTGRSRTDEAADRSFERFLVSLDLLRPEQIGPLVRTARNLRVPSLQLIRAEGLASDDELYGAVAAFHDLPFLAHPYRDLMPTVSAEEALQCLRENWIILESKDGKRLVAAAPTSANTTTLRNLGGSHGLTDPIDAITTPAAIRSWIRAVYGDVLLQRALLSVEAVDPGLSARRRFTGWQVAVAAGLAGILGAMSVIVPDTALVAIYATGTIAFLAVALLMVILLVAALPVWRQDKPKAEPREQQALPVYTILVPLYRKAKLVPRITETLWKLDYPRAKLDIKIIVEHDDKETRAAIDRLGLPQCFDTILVPSTGPRTRPRALNYALAFARGEFVAVYDAESVPEPDQLHRALAAFDAGDGDLACIQTRLVVDGSGGGWLSRQSAIGLAGLFEVLLPALETLRLSPALTSSAHHLRLSALQEVGGWDPYNVNESVDIAVRLDRFGYRGSVIASRTSEKALSGTGAWLGQKTRRFHGALQTYLVNMRDPIALWRDVGPRRFLALQVSLAAGFVSALAHPLFVAYLLFAAVSVLSASTGTTALHDALLFFSAVSLLIGYGAVIELCVFGLYRIGRSDLLPHLALIPAYWLLASVAAYGAVLRYLIRPVGREDPAKDDAEVGAASTA